MRSEISSRCPQHPAAKYIKYYINVYNIDQHTVTEEGGWYYQNHDCHTSIGIFCDPCMVSLSSRDHRFDALITTTLQYLQSFEPKWQDDGAAQEIFNDLNDRLLRAYDTDRYGCGELVEISRTPGNRHDSGGNTMSDRQADHRRAIYLHS
jgi:hypothetical protein